MLKWQSGNDPNLFVPQCGARHMLEALRKWNRRYFVWYRCKPELEWSSLVHGSPCVWSTLSTVQNFLHLHQSVAQCLARTHLCSEMRHHHCPTELEFGSWSVAGRLRRFRSRHSKRSQTTRLGLLAQLTDRSRVKIVPVLEAIESEFNPLLSVCRVDTTKRSPSVYSLLSKTDAHTGQE